MTPPWRIWVASVTVLASVTVWFLSGDSRSPDLSPPAVAHTSPPVAPDPEPKGQNQSPLITLVTPSIRVVQTQTTGAVASPIPRHPARDDSVPTLEQRIRLTRAAEERAELVSELARVESAEAVLALERLFSIERHPKVQVTLIASLLKVGDGVQPDARLRILRAAMANQPRDVRTTALEVLAESDDPTARELVRKSSVSDPDHEVREVAAALYKANRPSLPQGYARGMEQHLY